MILNRMFVPMSAQTPTQGAQCTLYCALSNEVEGVTGRYWINCKQREIEAAGNDQQGARKLWRLSEKWAGLEGAAHNANGKDTSA